MWHTLGAALAALLMLAAAAPIAADPIQDTPFWQEFHEAYPLATPEEKDVRALAFDAQGRLWAATGAGVRWLDGQAWRTPPGGAEVGSSYALHLDAAGTLWIGAWNGLYRATPERVTLGPIRDTPVSAIGSIRHADGAVVVFAAGPHGIWRSSSEDWYPLEDAWHRGIRAVLPTPDGRLWIGTTSGLYRLDLESRRTAAYSRPSVLLSSSVSDLAPMADGGFCIASSGGLDYYAGTKRVRSISAPQGLPCRQVSAIARDSEGRLWLATKLGVARLDGTRWNLFHSRRWLASDEARDVAIGPDGAAWVATAGGVDAIRRKRMTLAEKAAYFLAMLRARHIREPGLVGPMVLDTPGDVSKGFIEDDDNDGEHTGMYCAMESMRYAVTKAPDARENARAAFHALMVLQQATGTPHFIARSVLPIGTPPRHEVDRTFTPEQIADTNRDDPREKIIEKRWVPTADGKWLWKRDASSDEVCGHMVGYAMYYDLAATEDEKKLVADQVDRIVGGIADHGFTLRDIDGTATRWGNWAPASLNGDPTWHEERPGNSIEILAHLGVAYNMTGKQKYLDAARELIEKHGYDRNMTRTIFDTASERTHIEDELLSITYPNLFTHLIVPTLSPAAQTSLRNWHKWCAPDGIPFYDFVYARFSGTSIPLSRAVETLREWPLDMVEWTVDNSKREDVKWDRTPGRDESHLTRILPRGEMGLCNWDQEPYRAVIGMGGTREDKPTDWLLAYWMGRYWGLVGGPP